jgi:hypothetical protein
MLKELADIPGKEMITVTRRVVRSSSARRDEDDEYQIVEAAVSAKGMARQRSSAYPLEEATALCRGPIVILQWEMLGTVEKR